MSTELLQQIALTLVPHIGPVQAKILLQHFNVSELFRTSRHTLEKIEGIGSIRAYSISGFNDFARAEKEINFIQQQGIRPLFITDKDYPQRLLNCYDPPTLLYYKGSADLNLSRIVSIVGSRSHTEYGKLVTEKLIGALSVKNVLVVSGLAYGIDAIAHKTSLKQQVPTVGVLAHGLDLIYPSQHIALAKEMLAHGGGLLTEFMSGASPDRHNFPARNRIVAGMCDATVVVETSVKGGSMITAELANNYNKDVFAFPGKVTDSKSAGCNKLIRHNKAILLSEGEELLELMGWEEKKPPSPAIARELFIELLPNEKLIVDIIKEKDWMHIDEINFKSRLSNSAVAAAILGLELKGLIGSKPGRLYGITY